MAQSLNPIVVLSHIFESVFVWMVRGVIGRSRRKWKKHTCATRLTCSRIDNSASNMTPGLRTTVVESTAVVPARTTLSLGEILLKLTADPNQRTSVLLAFNCKCFAAHQWLTSVKQLVRVDAIRGTSAGGPCVIGKQMIEKFVLLQYTCDIFGILDKLFRSKYQALRNTGLQGYWNRLMTTSSAACVRSFRKSARYTKAPQHYVIENCVVEGSGKIKEHQRSNMPSINGLYQVIHDAGDCRLRRMKWTIGTIRGVS